MSLLNNVKWVALSQVVKVGLQLISLTVLTRLLAPTEYGLMAMATVVTNFTLIIRDLGTAAAIIQRKELSETATSTVFWLNIMMGTLICAFIMLASPFIADLFNAESLVPVLLWLALSFPIASSAATHQALLERSSKFRLIAGLEIISAASGLLVAIVMAYAEMGVFSLVGQTLISCSLSSWFFWQVSKWRPTRVFDKKELRVLLGFSGNLTAFNLINYFSRNADGMIIGYYFSAAILGAYSLAYKVMLFPLQSLTSVATRSLYPIMSKQQDNAQAVKAMYLKTILVISSITAPLMAGLAVLREPFVHFVFGDQWLLVPSLLLWLAPTGFIQSIVSTSGSVFMAKGNTNLLMKLGILSSLLMVGSFIVGAKFDLRMLVFLYFSANLINAIPAMFFTMRSISGSLFDVVEYILPAVFSSSIMSVFVYMVNSYLGEGFQSFIISLVSGFFVYIAVYGVLFPKKIILILPRRLHKLINR